MKTFSKYFLLFIVLADIFVLAGFGVFAFQVSNPLNTESSKNKVVVIEKGSSLNQIASQLKKEGLVRSARTFSIYAVLERQASGMQAGVYVLSSTMTIKEMADIISKGNIADYQKVTIPEGYTSSQIANLFEGEGVLDGKQDLLNFVSVSTQTAFEIYEFDFLQKLRAKSLEGFLFPDTYEFRVNSSTEEVVARFLANFEQKTLHLFNGEATGYATDYSPYDILILASLLEEEVQTEEDMKIVAGVLYNRLSINMALQVDATLIYLTGKQTTQITASDKQIESPFNTYKYGGLPPAPISNPGLRAINAAMNPTSTNYLYYISAPDGTTYFAETFDKHNENIARYLR